MVKNNIALLIFHFIVSLIFYKLYQDSYEDQVYLNLIIYLVLLILYFLFGYIFGKFSVYYNSRFKNLFSVSSTFMLAILAFVIIPISMLTIPSYYPYTFLFFGFSLLLGTPLIEFVNPETTGLEFILSYLTLFTLVIATWLGLELRNRNRNGLNKDIEKEESVE